MSRFRSTRRFGMPFREGAYGAEVDEEMSFHLEKRTEKLVSQGWDPAEAEQEARRRFGDAEAIRRRMVSHERRGAVMRSWLDMVTDGIRDVRHAARSLLRTPTLTAASVLILAVGIGTTAAFFAVVHAVVLEPMPFVEPDRVAQIEVRAGPEGRPSTLVSPGVLMRWQDGVAGVEAVAGIASITAALTADELPMRVLGYAVSHGYTTVIGVLPSLGRTFTPADDIPGADPVMLLSHRLWQRVFASDASILGRQVMVDGVATAVVGVMPAELDVLEGEGEFWRPLRLDPDQRANVGTQYLSALARLRGGVTLAEAERGLDGVLRALDLRSNDGQPYEAALTSIEDLLSRPLRPILFVTLAAMGLVLLIGCGNVATLLLARGARRERELAIRSALGAGRARLAQGLLLEGVILAAASSAVGLVLAQWGVALLRTRTPFPVPRLQEATLNLPVLLFTVALAAATAIVFGFVPALRGARVDVRSALASGEGATGGIASGRDRVRSTFIGIQAALSLVLLVGAGLLVRTSLELRSVPNGYRAEGVLSGLVALPFARYPDLASVLERYGEIHGALASLPSVERAAIGSRVPLTGAGAGYGFLMDGDPDMSRVQTRLRIIGPDYFATLGTSVVAGRELRAEDDGSSVPSVVVNQAFVRSLGTVEAEAVGRRVYAEGGGPFADSEGNAILWEIVGVVEDARDQGPRRAARPELFFALEQAPEGPWNWLGRQMVLTLRTSGDPADLVVPLQRAIRALDAELPVYDVRTLSDRLEGALARERFVAMVVSAIGAIGLLLAATGIFGTVAYRVSSRTREIGVRIALGAPTRGVVRMIVRQSLRPVLLGLVVGVPLAWLASRSLAMLLFGVGPGDPLVVAAAAAALLVVSALAATLPARRATAVQPVQALRAG